jgi:putative hydrolase of the HAD superfamily
VTVLVLDLDGVVVLGHPEGGHWPKHLLRDLGLAPERLQECFFRTHFEACVLGQRDLFEALDDAWPQLGWDGSPQALVDYWFAMDSRLDGEVLAEVDAWRSKGGRAFLATVQEHHRARHVWEYLRLRERFDGLIHSAALGARKPDRTFFERATARLPIEAPGEVLFLDDLPANVDAARSFGWQAHLHTGPEDLRRAMAEG